MEVWFLSIMVVVFTLVQQGSAQYQNPNSLDIPRGKEPMESGTTPNSVQQQLVSNSKALMRLVQQELLMLSLLVSTVVRGDWLFGGGPQGTPESKPTVGSNMYPTESSVLDSGGDKNDPSPFGPPGTSSPSSTPGTSVVDPGSGNVLFAPLPLTSPPNPSSESVASPSAGGSGIPPPTPTTSSYTTPYPGEFNPLAGDQFHLTLSGQNPPPAQSVASPPGSIDPLDFPVQYYKPEALQTPPTSSQGGFNPLAQLTTPSPFGSYNNQGW